MAHLPGAFADLSVTQQLRRVLRQGTYLAQRRHPAGSHHLYHLPEGPKGLFVEVHYDAALDLIRVARSFADTAPLAEYLPALP